MKEIPIKKEGDFEPAAQQSKNRFVAVKRNGMRINNFSFPNFIPNLKEVTPIIGFKRQRAMHNNLLFAVNAIAGIMKTLISGITADVNFTLC
jgi:hypothetical protein